MLILEFTGEMAEVLADVRSRKLQIALHVGDIAPALGSIGMDSQDFVNLVPGAAQTTHLALLDGGRLLVPLSLGLGAICSFGRRRWQSV
jgi:hypothetical protein